MELGHAGHGNAFNVGVPQRQIQAVDGEACAGLGSDVGDQPAAEFAKIGGGEGRPLGRRFSFDGIPVEAH